MAEEGKVGLRLGFERKARARLSGSAEESECISYGAGPQGISDELVFSPSVPLTRHYDCLEICYLTNLLVYNTFRENRPNVLFTLALQIENQYAYSKYPIVFFLRVRTLRFEICKYI